MKFNIYTVGNSVNLASPFPWDIIPAIASAISAVLLLIVTYKIFKWDSKRDIVDYVPQLFLRSEHKPILHPVFSSGSLNDFYYSRPYEFYLVNISNKKIVDLEVELEVIEEETYNELLNYVNESGIEYIHKVDDKSFAYGGVLGDDYKSFQKEDLLSGDETLDVKVPGSFHIALLGYNLMAQQEAAAGKEDEDIEDKTINTKMTLEYNHAFSNEKIHQEYYFNINFSMGMMNTTIEWDSYLFEQK